MASVPKSLKLQTIMVCSDDGLLHTNRVELLPNVDRIHGDSEHPKTEIGVEVEEIYFRVVAHAGGHLRLG